jgi:hypothetical protein
MSTSNRAKTGEPAMRALKACLPEKVNAAGIVRELSDLGYIIIPKAYTKPARRGNEVQKPYDPWIGKSHSARLLHGG